MYSRLQRAEEEKPRKTRVKNMSVKKISRVNPQIPIYIRSEANVKPQAATRNAIPPE